VTGDFDEDGNVIVADLLALLAGWGPYDAPCVRPESTIRPAPPF
jgi:hypothetical protein